MSRLTVVILMLLVATLIACNMNTSTDTASDSSVHSENKRRPGTPISPKIKSGIGTVVVSQTHYKASNWPLTVSEATLHCQWVDGYRAVSIDVASERYALNANASGEYPLFSAVATNDTYYHGLLTDALHLCGSRPKTSPIRIPTSPFLVPTLSPKQLLDPESDEYKGFHCLSGWDGDHPEFKKMASNQLQDPKSLESLGTLIGPVSNDGNHHISMTFTAGTIYGGRQRLVAEGYVDNKTCKASLISVTPG